MSLMDAIMRGTEFRCSYYGGPQPIDLVARARGSTLIAFAGWWKAQWDLGNGLEIVTGNLVEAEQGTRWKFDGGPEGALIASSGDGDMQARIDRTRVLQDTQRAEYLNAVSILKEQNPEYDFDGWIETFMERPLYDPVEAYRKKQLGSRKTSGLLLLDRDNTKVDVLLVDEHGNAAVAAGSEWLTVFANRWTEMEDRPDPQSFIEWVATQRPYGPHGLSEPFVSSAEGHIEDLAARRLSG
jgi:hypothetical protein